MMRRRGGPTHANGGETSIELGNSETDGFASQLNGKGHHLRHARPTRSGSRVLRGCCTFFMKLFLALVLLGVAYMGYIRIFSNHTDMYSLEGVRALLQDATAAYNDEFVVFVTLSNGMPGETYIGLGRSDAVDKALRLAQQNLPRKTTTYPYLKVDVITGIFRLEDFDYSRPIEAPGPWYGVALDWEHRWTFLPEEALSQALVDRNGILRWERIVSYARTKKLAGWPVPPFTDDEMLMETPLDLFHTSSIFYNLAESDPQPIPLYHGHRMFDTITVSMLRNAIEAGASYLARSVDQEGHITHLYLPRSDLVATQYSLTRHAGALYAMARVYHTWKDQNLLQSMQRAVKHLLQYADVCAVPFRPNDFARCIIEPQDEDNQSDKQQVRLETNAQALIGLAEYFDATDDTHELPTAKGIASWITQAQDKDGWFAQLVYLPDVKLDQDYYVRFDHSKAIFALTRFYNVVHKQAGSPTTASQEWVQAAGRAAQVMMEDDRGLDDEQLTVDGWLLKSLSELHLQGYKMDAATFTEHLARSVKILRSVQYTEMDDEEGKDGLGVYYGDYSSARTAILSEGLCSVYKLAMDVGLVTEADMIGESVHYALRYQMQSQYLPESSMYMKDPVRINGAFSISPLESEIRSDYTQYNICSMLCATELLEQKRGEVGDG